jgi:hypothetical protein
MLQTPVRLRFLTCVIAAACMGDLIGTSEQASATDASTPLEVFGRLPTLEDVIISPDGLNIAFVNTSGDQRTLFWLSSNATFANARGHGGISHSKQSTEVAARR